MIIAMALQAPINPTPPASQPLLQWADYWYAWSWPCAVFAGAVAAVGAFAMVAFLMLQWRAASIREAHSIWLAANLEAQTAQARRDAADALERVAVLNKEAASLNRKNLSLQEIVQPRHLTAAQVHDVAQTLAHQSGRSVTLWSYKLDMEGAALAEQIRHTLIDAHIIVVNNIGQLTSTDLPRLGVQIAGADQELVNALHDGLHGVAGLDAAVVELDGVKPEDAPPAEIFIGMKPVGRQTVAETRDASPERSALFDQAAVAAVAP